MGLGLVYGWFMLIYGWFRVGLGLEVYCLGFGLGFGLGLV